MYSFDFKIHTRIKLSKFKNRLDRRDVRASVFNRINKTFLFNFRVERKKKVTYLSRNKLEWRFVSVFGVAVVWFVISDDFS